MQKTFSSLLLIAITLLFAGCASSRPVGILFTDLQLPVTATANPTTAGTKKGTATCESYLGLITHGEASIEKAAQAGGIKRISHVDWEVKNVLGVWGIYTVTVYGE